MLIEMFLLRLSKASSAFCTALLVRKVRAVGSLGGDTAGQVTQTAQRDIPDHVISCAVYKVGGRGRKGDMFGVMTFVFPVNLYV